MYDVVLDGVICAAAGSDTTFGDIVDMTVADGNVVAVYIFDMMM